MLADETTMLILSCDKYSDLWDAYVHQLEMFWPDRGMETYIVTDEKCNQKYRNITIIPFENCSEWSNRFQKAVDFVKTEYVFVTLDDYFLIKPISTSLFDKYVEMMNKEKIDYLRLVVPPRKSNNEKLRGYNSVRMIDTDKVYSVNMYSGIWRKSFLQKTFDAPLSAWEYEVKLARRARENNAKCVMTTADVYPFLDVVRKGKLLRKADKYLKKVKIYNGSREVNSWQYEMELRIRQNIIEYAPQWIVNAIRNFMIKHGRHFYSQDA